MYDRIFGDFPARNTVYTPYIYTWFWLTLFICDMHALQGTTHPSSVVSHLFELAEPLQLADQAARGAGNQLGLSEVDESIRDIMTSVSHGTIKYSVLASRFVCCSGAGRYILQ